MKILVFYVDKQYFNMVILFLRLRVRRELIIRRDGRAVEGTGLENRRCESIRGFESHSLRQLNFSIDLRKYPRGRRGSPAEFNSPDRNEICEPLYLIQSKRIACTIR